MILVVVALALAATEPPPAPPTPPTPPTPRSAPPRADTTALLSQHAGQLIASASSTWPGWGPERLIDGKRETSWFSAKGDAAAQGRQPWVALRFPLDVTVSKVTVLGNREPNWLQGFTVHYGVLELLDAKDAVLFTMKNEGKNKLADIDFVLKTPVAGVRTVRFVALMDEGNQTQFADIALGELLVE